MIYLKIGNYTNKGDGLMLHAIINRLGEQTDLVCLSQVADYKVRARMGLYQALWFESIPTFQNQLLANAFPSFLKIKYGLVADGEFDAVIDASGFAYGDQWGEPKIKMTADKVERWKKEGKKIIFLPQSLGSFKKPEVKKHFLRIVEAADLIFARDKTSYEYATEAAGNVGHIRQAPDFTGALRGKKPDWFEAKERMACIIPNHRMIDSTDDQVGPRYLPFLHETYEAFEKQGMHPFVLVHEKVDYDVALQLQKSLGKKIEIVYDDSPLVLRGIIAECHIVLSSRFHGLISTLSQSVPCLGTRWAHKFERVMEEYGMEDYLVSPLDAPEQIMEKIMRLDQSPTRQEAIDSISSTVAQHQALNNQMWEEVEKVLGLDKKVKRDAKLTAV
jgi:colanic acid/amylovoran biosynthesis protein